MVSRSTKPNAFLFRLWTSSLKKPIPIIVTKTGASCDWPVSLSAPNVAELVFAIDSLWHNLNDGRNLSRAQARERKVLAQFIEGRPDTGKMPKVIATWSTKVDLPHRGVHFDRLKGKWRAVHKGRHLGWFKTKDAAIAAKRGVENG